MKHKETLQQIAQLESEPHFDTIGIWSPYIEQGDISIPKKTKPTKNKPSRQSKTWLRSTSFLMTIKHVIRGDINHFQNWISFGLAPCHGIAKVFKIKIAHVERFVEDEQGTHIVIAKLAGLKMFYGHDFVGEWIPVDQWGNDDADEYFEPTQTQTHTQGA